MAAVTRVKRACVVVLGDIGRSPRMQYHALSLNKEGYIVDIVGYGGSSPHADLLVNPNAHFHLIKEPPDFSTVFPRFLMYMLKVLWLTAYLIIKLTVIQTPSFILVQNPPSLPAIPICWMMARIRGVPFIIDWHNYGYTILALSLGPKHVFVKIYHFLERFFGTFANLHFCVTKAMSDDLKKNWNIVATTLYDRPAENFHPISLMEQHELFLKLGKQYSEFCSSTSDQTVSTERFAGESVRMRADRPGLLVSSTSWTEDEDFSILFNALDAYDQERSSNLSRYPPLLCVITGKGPLKSYYQKLVRSRQWQHIEVCMPWLDPQDYPKLLASADLGVSLHTSSSGLDLPMKVVDMFGCGLPVCAADFPCLSELVRPGENGVIFKAAEDLAQQLLAWFCNFPRDIGGHQLLKTNLQSFQTCLWHPEWKKIAFSSINSICNT